MKRLCKWKFLPPAFRFRDEGAVERHLAVAPTFKFNKMVRGRSTPVVFGGHFHVTRFGMFRSRAGLALNPWSTAASPRTAYRHRPYLHTQGVIRTAPPSRSRVKNDYSIIGMLSREISTPPFIIVIRGLDPRIPSFVMPANFLDRHPGGSRGPAWRV